jgi:hypothetical protein
VCVCVGVCVCVSRVCAVRTNSVTCCSDLRAVDLNAQADEVDRLIKLIDEFNVVFGDNAVKLARRFSAMPGGEAHAHAHGESVYALCWRRCVMRGCVDVCAR